MVMERARLGLGMGMGLRWGWGTRSVTAVRFGPVQRPIFPNPGLDLGFGSAKLSNLGLDLRFKFSEVRFKFRGGLDRFEPIFVLFAARVYNRRNHPPPNIPEYTPFPRNAGLF
jgi:hypothetical protein